MSNKGGKSFKVPKIRRPDNKDNLRQVDVTSRDCLEIVNIVKRSYLASDYETGWQLKTAALVENRELEAIYRAKKAELKEEGRHARDLTDQYAFIVQRDNTIVPYVVKDGLRCKSVYQSTLGDSKMGVYLWRNADVQLKLSEGWKIPTCTLLVFKVVLGKCKSLVQQHGEENIEPTPNYDSHIAQIQARPSDNFGTQLTRSQVYLYEYTEDCEPSDRPRQVLPYAVLTYEKTDSGPSRSLNTKVDSYSKRPAPLPRLPEADTTKSNTAKTIMNRRDPRLAKADSNLKPSEGVDGGLCVPRLTSGPPRDRNASVVTSVSDPDDPRSQLSFLTSSVNQKFEEFPYQPSFGPGSEEQESSQEESEPQEPLTSLPPLKLPDQTNSQLDTRYTDPRFGYVDTSANVIPNDPRLRPSDPNFVSNDPRLRPSDPKFVSNDPRLRAGGPGFVANDPRLRSNDPRLQSVPLDPRLQQMSLDPRRQQMPPDPRLQQQPPDPRLNVTDLRIQQPLNQRQNVNFPVTQRVGYPQSEDSSKMRKKLTLSDYKKKVNISKPENTMELTPSTNVVENMQEQKTFSSDNDITTQTTVQSVTAKYGSVYKTRPDPRLSSQSSEDTSKNYTPSPEQQPDQSVSVTAEEDKSQGIEEDFVEEPDDMAKTLNELSDPDDISQSPKQYDEPVTEKPSADDPMLSDAMQKLVEHSGNVTLFTEALRLLQESAEQFGEQLTDPEFLVKKIAEKIDELSKLEAQKLEESNQPSTKDNDDIQEIDSPDRIMSPDLSNDSKNDTSAPVKHIPLESVDTEVEKSLECVDMDIESESETESKLDLAMQKTLQELAKLEQSKSAKLSNTGKYGNKNKTKKSKKESSPDLHLLDIPIPPDPPKEAKLEAQKKIQGTPMISEDDNKKSGIKQTKAMPQTENVEEDMKVMPILPSLKEKRKPVISINLKMNQKSNFKPKTISPEKVLDIFKDDLDMRVKGRPATKELNLGKKKGSSDNDEKLDFGLVDKDFRKVSVEETHPSKLSAIDREKKNEKNENKGVDKFHLDKQNMDGSKAATKGNEVQNAGLKISAAKFIDPFGLGSEDIGEDIDHRNISESDSQKKEVNDFGDIDWRTASDVPIADVDMRSTDTSTDNSQCSDLGDFDLRSSHSRSVSPPPRTATSNKETSFKQPVKKFVDPFGLDEDTDERIISRSNSPLVSENLKVSRMQELAQDSSQDSDSGPGALFDAYSVGKSKSDNMGHTSNEFGDIDWRQAAAAEMGDVDLRSVPVEKPKLNGPPDQRTVTTSTAAPVIISEPKTHNADPFQQMNKNLQNMFNPGQSIPQYHTSVSSYDTYSTSQAKNTQSYESYTTSKGTVAGEYRTSSNPDNKYLQSYTTSGNKQKTPNQEGFHNIMQNLDFSNLKNILATVKQPDTVADPVGKDSGDDQDNKEEDNDKPAFVTGLSSMNNKPGEKRKYGSVYKQYSPSKKHLNKDEPQQKNSDSEKPVIRIPGFDVTPEKDVHEVDRSTKNTDSVKEKSKSPSPEKSGKSKVKDKKLSDIKASDSLPTTPKDKMIKDSEDVMTPLPDISYQAAILESMEQSALKVRNDDSFTSEMEESPIRTPKRHRSKSTRSVKNIISGTKRKQDSVEEILSHKVVKREQDENKTDDDDDDDEESGLVIDLDIMSPVVKNSSDKESPAVKRKMLTDTVDLTSEPILDLTDDVEPVLVIDDEEEGDKADSDDLHVEDTVHAKTKDEMTDMIEKSRKNMVIKLKGETKLVNPKTGKAYNECPRGSAIEVLGQTSKEVTTHQIHPIHGIVSVNRGSTATAKASSEQANVVQGQPIQAIGNSGKSNQSIKPNISTSSEVGVVTGNKVYGQVPQRQTNQSTTQCSTAPSVFGNAAPISNVISGLNKTVSPITLIPTVNQVQQQPPKHLEYVHPLTGRTLAYGRLPVPQTASMQPPIVPIPRATIPMSNPQLVPQPVPQPVPPPAVLSQVSRNVLILPGQRPSGVAQVTARPAAVRLPFMPARLSQQRPGITTQTFGTMQTNKKVLVSPGQLVGPKISPGTTESKTSTDVFDCFRDKFEKREIKKEGTDVQNYEMKPTVSSGVSSETKMAYSVKMFLEDIENKAKKELNAQAQINARSINTIIKGEHVVKKQTENVQTSESTDVSSKKRPGDEESNTTSAKKIKNESDTKIKPQNDFGSRILESLTEVKNKLKSPEKTAPSPEKTVIKPKLIELKTEVKTIKDEVKKELAESGASSELEDGEISEDSISDSEEPIKMETQQAPSRSAGASIPVLGSGPSQFNRIPTIGSWQQSSPSMGMNIRYTQPRPITTIGSNKPNVSAYKVGADWADIIQNPETRALERVKATNIESPSLRGTSGESGEDTVSLVSKSAASISKSRQKNKAQSLVKTLGEWLQLELEIDNIEPLQNIIPYALDTDLTKIPKQRKRRIRMKVKNAIQQEGTKASSSFERNDTVTVEVLLSNQEAAKPLNPSYSPEVSNEQTERELKMLGTSLNFIREKVKQQAALSQFNRSPYQQGGQFGQFLPRSVAGSVEDKKLIVAMTLVESEMRTHLGRTCFYGYPHRRVPEELLLKTEVSGFKSEAEEVFLILMMPLSTKPYHKLLQLRNNLNDLYERRKAIRNPADITKIDEEIRQSHNQRQAVLRGFTGYLNKKRIQKLQETVDKYTQVYDYFRSKTPPTPDSMLRFIRTTQMDLRQHLILAKQYLALEEQKMQL